MQVGRHLLDVGRHFGAGGRETAQIGAGAEESIRAAEYDGADVRIVVDTD